MLMLNKDMENEAESFQWREIIQQYPEWMNNYRASTNNCLDQLVDQYRKLVNNRTRLTNRASTDILFALAEMYDAMERLRTDDTLLVQGRGMYYAQESQTLDFLDGSPGVSGYFTGLHIDTLPLYHDMVYRKKMIYRPLLCIALEGYSLHNRDNTPGLFIDDTVVIPIIGQDLCITHYDDSIVNKAYL
jgi:hypothetical protein